MNLVTETLGTIRMLTEELRDCFLTVEMADRFAAMLNGMIGQMAGPNIGQYKLKDAASLNFEPRALIVTLLSIYCNFADDKRLSEAMARDERYFKPQHFQKASNIVRQRGLLLSESVDAFDAIVREAQACSASNESDDTLYADAPGATKLPPFPAPRISLHPKMQTSSSTPSWALSCTGRFGCQAAATWWTTLSSRCCRPLLQCHQRFLTCSAEALVE